MTVLTQTPNTPEAWSERARTEPTSWGACGWTEQGQTERFGAVIDALDPAWNESLLDFGCGTGELSVLLPLTMGYLGYDSAPGMVERAKREHPERMFQQWEPSHSFDLIACVGPFNLPDGWCKQRTWAALRRLWDATTRTLAVSLYAGDDERCLVYNEAECETFAAGETYRWLVDRWRPNDILVVLDRGPRKRVF